MLRVEGLGQLKTLNDLIGIRTRDLPACTIVSQPTTLPRTRSGIEPGPPRWEASD
jgi:hypothetical protein